MVSDLVCLRPAHKRHGGLWEFPGGKCEPGESDPQALARELEEELALELLRCDAPVLEVSDPGSHFRIAFVPVDVRGEPVALEHDAVAWHTPAELERMPLAPSDRRMAEALQRDGRDGPTIPGVSVAGEPADR